MSVSQTSKKIAANTIYQLVGKAVSMCITVVGTIIITRSYGREIYGQFSLMQQWPALFFVIADFGMNAIATREISKDWSKAGKYFGNILIFRVIFSLVLMLLIGFFVRSAPYSTGLVLGITLSGALILTQSLFTTTNIIFQVKMRYDLSTIGYLAGYTFILLLIFFFSSIKADVAWLSLSYVFGGLVTFLINYMFILKVGVIPEFKLDKNTISYLVINSLPLGLMFVFSQVNFKADSLLLSLLPIAPFIKMGSEDLVALYSLPYKIFEVALVLPTFFMNSVYPVMVLKAEGSGGELKNTLRTSLRFLFLSSILISAVIFISAPLIIDILGGREFVESVLVLRILSIGLFLYSMTQPLAWIIVTLGFQKYLPFIYLISAVFNVIANLIIIPIYSFYGSAVITHLSEFLILCMLLFTVRKVWLKTYGS